MQKYIKEVFNDYELENNLIDAEIENINLYKKTNKIQLNVVSSKKISLNEKESFEDYLVNKFKVGKSSVYVKYKDIDFDCTVLEDWDKIISYIAKREPFSKAILADSKIELDNNKITVKLSLRGATFLSNKKFDKELEQLLLDLYNKRFKLVFIEDVEENYNEIVSEDLKIREKNAITELQNQAKEEAVQKKARKKTDENSTEEKTPLIYGKTLNIKSELMKISEISVDTNRVCIEGEVVEFIENNKDEKIVKTEYKDIKDNKVILTFNLHDGTSTITCKVFLEKLDAPDVIERIEKAEGLKINGTARYDQYAKEITITASTIIEIDGKKKEKRIDNSEKKRVELHVHTKMSQLDAVTPCADLLKKAISWGWKSIAITDHGVVQAFTDVHKFLNKSKADFKVIYGVEAYFVPDKDPSVFYSKGQSLNTEFCVLDLETTGLSHITEKITEIGILKIKNGQIIDTFECFVDPQRPIPLNITKITGITDEMVKSADTIEKIIPKVIDFLGDSVLVAHNAQFDIGFLKQNFEENGYEFKYTYIDTVRLAKMIFPDLKRYKLGIIAESLNIKVDVAHRALDDVKTLVNIFNIMIEKSKQKNAKTIDDFSAVFDTEVKNLPVYHAIILAKNYVGLKNLYKLVSFSHVDYFYKKPRMLKSLFNENKEGLLLGSACEVGEIYRAILDGKTEEEIIDIAKIYDYLEIQPIGNNENLLRDGSVKSKEDLIEINRKIVKLGDKLNKPVVATCDVHFLDPEDEIYRRILQAGQKYDDADMQAPLYLRTTEEMLEEFDYLGKEKAYEVVVKNTNLISDMCENIKPISSEQCRPHLKGSEEEITKIAYERAEELYGNPLPKIVKDRLDKELESIIKNKFAVMYIIAQKLVKKSNEDGYLVGSRGSVGSSFAAYVTGITEVNSLKPHYVCKNCKYSDFSDHGVKNGFDLPDKKCPKCSTKLNKDGMDIPFETFLGFDGDKEPDIDLNFSGEYQQKAHRYAEAIFENCATYKAGTVSTIKKKTAYGYVKNYYDERNIIVPNAEKERVIVGCHGVKRTTGQHPGGIIVVPEGREIYEFSPIQHPADASESDIITTHFDYHSIEENLLKLDILGHDDPTMIRMLQDLTGVDPLTIPLDDKETMSIFFSTKALGIEAGQINSEVGTFGVPEFGTKFVRGMLIDTKPKTFEELVRISGLSHGTDVWLGNAKDLISSNTATLSEAICTRDDIMIYLIKMGLPSNVAFKVMESVRKGKSITEEQEKLMNECNVPNWYISSCKKIKYMFPKAHAAAYVTMAVRIAWFKVHRPKAYYTAYFSIRADEFDSEIMIFGKEKVKNRMKEIEMSGNAATEKEEKMYPVLESVLEMYERDINFLNIDLYKSHATKFIMEEEGIRPPLNSIPGIGVVAAEGIYKAGQEEKFMCIDDMQARSKIGKSVTELLQKFGCLKDMAQSNQMSLF